MVECNRQRMESGGGGGGGGEMPPVSSVSDPGPHSGSERGYGGQVCQRHTCRETPKKPDCRLTQARLRCAYLEFNPDFRCPLPLSPFVFDQWALCSFTFFSFFCFPPHHHHHLHPRTPCRFNLLHHPHPPSSPPPNIRTLHRSARAFPPPKKKGGERLSGVA